MRSERLEQLPQNKKRVGVLLPRWSRNPNKSPRRENTTEQKKGRNEKREELSKTEKELGSKYAGHQRLEQCNSRENTKHGRYPEQRE